MRRNSKLKSLCPSGFHFLAMLAASSVLALAVGTPLPAEAANKKRPVQTYTAPSGGGLFGEFFAAEPKPYRVYGTQKPRPRPAGDPAAKSAKPAEQSAERPIKGPLVLTVSLGSQRLTVHDVDGPIAEAPISSGQAAFPTLQGVFTILEKNVHHYSNLYDGAPMPNMQRITWSGTALHAGHLPGYPASHGCIRLPYNFSKKLFGMTKLGTRVIVTRDAVAPAPFTHAKLITPLPPENDITTTGALGGENVPKPRETKVAEQVDYESVRSVSFVTAANAAEDVSSTPSNDSSPRSAYRAARAAELAQLEETLKGAGTAKDAAEQYAKLTVAAVDFAKAEAAKAKSEADRKAQAAKQAEQASITANRALEQHARKFDGSAMPAADVAEKVLSAETELEAKAASLQDAHEQAKLDAERAMIHRTATEANVTVAVKTAKEAAAKLSKANSDLKLAQAGLDNFRRALALRKNPVSVFISRSAKRLYVRQAHQPVFDVPVTFENPDAMIGTHVFTALEFNPGETDLRWSAVSIPTTAPMKQDAKKNKKATKADAEIAHQSVPSKSAQTAEAAWDRITIPDDARERIADVLKPGSSIIISDYGISHQTGEYTDFIILTR